MLEYLDSKFGVFSEKFIVQCGRKTMPNLKKLYYRKKLKINNKNNEKISFYI